MAGSLGQALGSLGWLRLPHTATPCAYVLSTAALALRLDREELDTFSIYHLSLYGEACLPVGYFLPQKHTQAGCSSALQRMPHGDTLLSPAQYNKG